MLRVQYTYDNRSEGSRDMYGTGYENRTDQSESPHRSLLGPRAFRWVGVWDLPSSEEFCMILDGRIMGGRKVAACILNFSIHHHEFVKEFRLFVMRLRTHEGHHARYHAR